MYNEFNQQNHVYLAGRNSNSCNSQTHGVYSAICDASADSTLQSIKPRSNVILKRTGENNFPSTGFSQDINRHNKIDEFVFVPLPRPKKQKSSKKNSKKKQGSQHATKRNYNVQSVERKENLESQVQVLKRGLSSETGFSSQTTGESGFTSGKTITDTNYGNDHELQSNQFLKATNTSNSNSFGIFITTNDTEQNNIKGVSSRVEPNVFKPNSPVHLKGGQTNDYSNKTPVNKRSTSSAYEKNSPQQKTRYVTELKLNLRKGRAEQVSKNWSSDNSDKDSSSDDQNKQMKVNDVQVKAILCRAATANEPPDQTSYDCSMSIVRKNNLKPEKNKRTSDSLVYLNPKPPSIDVQEKQFIDESCSKTNEFYVPVESNSAVTKIQLTEKNDAGCIGTLRSDTELKIASMKEANWKSIPTCEDQFNVRKITSERDKNEINSLQRDLPRELSPINATQSPTSKNGVPLLNTEAYSVAPPYEQCNDRPTHISKIGEPNQFMKEVFHQDSSCDEVSDAGGCTTTRSSVVEEPSVHSLTECVSSATVISPCAGKTSRGTQSEDLKQVKVVRDMQIQTTFMESSEDATPRSIYSHDSSSGKPTCSGRTSSISQDSRPNNFISRLPIPTMTHLQPQWVTSQATQPKNSTHSLQYVPIERKPDLDTKRFVSPSPTSFLVLTQGNSAPVNVEQAGSTQRPLVQNKDESLIKSPFGNQPLNSNIYWTENTVVTNMNQGISENARTNIPRSINKISPKLFQNDYPNLSKSLHAHTILNIECRSSSQDEDQIERTLTDDCQRDTGKKKGVVTNLIEGKSNTPFRIHNLTPPATGIAQRYPLANEDVLVEGSTTTNSSQNSVIHKGNTHHLLNGLGNQTMYQTESRVIATNARKTLLNTAGDYTTETCVCCKETTCDCPTSSTITGSQLCTCEYCHGSATTTFEPTGKIHPPNSAQYLRRTAGDEGSLHAPDNSIAKQCQGKNIIPKPTFVSGGSIRSAKPIPDESTDRCSCCSDSTLTETTIPPKQQVDQETPHPPYINEPYRHSTANPMFQTNLPDEQNRHRGNTIPLGVYERTQTTAMQSDDFKNKSKFQLNKTHQTPCNSLQTVRKNLTQGPSFLKKSSPNSRFVETNTRRSILGGDVSSQARPPVYATLANTNPQPPSSQVAGEHQSYQLNESKGEKMQEGKQHINPSKITSTNPNIDTLLNLVGEKEKRTILQRWLLEQVAYSTKMNHGGNKDHSPEDVRLLRECGKDEGLSGTLDNVSESESVCSCSACQEAIGARKTRENRVNIGSSSGAYSPSYSESYINEEINKRKNIAKVSNTQGIPRRDKVELAQMGSEKYLNKTNIVEHDIPLGQPLYASYIDSGQLRGRLPMRKLAARSNSEGSLTVTDGRRGMFQERLLTRKRTSRSVGWRTTEDPIMQTTTVTNAISTGPSIQYEHNLWNSHGSRFNSPVKNVHPEPALRNNGPSLTKISGTKSIPDGFQQKENNKIPLNRTIQINRELNVDKRQTIKTLADSSKLPEVQQPMNTTLRNKTLNGAIGAVTKLKSDSKNLNQGRLAMLKESKTLSTNGNAGFQVERVFELSQYDDLVKSHLSAADRRIKAVALKNGCGIRIEGPIHKPDPSSNGITCRTKVSYHCYVAGPNEDRVGKCINFLKETFPNSFLRSNWRA